MPVRELATHPRVIRYGKFGAVGVLNTLIDFFLYNLFSSVFKLTLIQSNIISTTVAMMFSFGANKKVVFKKHDGHMGKQAVLFFAVTAFGLYILQSATIHFLTEVWLYPVSLFVGIAHMLGVTAHDQFLIKNSAKAIATIVSLTWNYVMYRRVVFA